MKGVKLRKGFFGTFVALFVFLPFHGLSFTIRGQLYPGASTQHSQNYFIENPHLTYGGYQVMKSRNFILEAGSPSTLEKRPPEIYYVSPSLVYHDEAPAVSIKGNYFTSFPNAPSVAVDDVFSPQVNVISPQLITFQFPQGISPGYHAVSVIYPGEFETSLTNAIYVGFHPPVIKSVRPNILREGARTEIEVKGEYFQEGITGALGTFPLTLSFVTAEVVRFYPPEGISPGYYTLALTNPDGNFALLTNAVYVIGETGELAGKGAGAGGCGCYYIPQGTGFGALPLLISALVLFALGRRKSIRNHPDESEKT